MGAPGAAMQWHDYSALLRDAFAAGDAAEFDRLRLAAFAAPGVIRRKGMAYEPNVHGHAYCAMGSADMMARLTDGAVKWQRRDYADLAVECARPLLTRWSKGGLRSDKGGWIHSRTSSTQETPGGTLNQALIAARSMASSANDFDRLDMPGLAVELRSGALDLIDHLADPDAWPNWSSFVVMKRRRPIARSWLAYAIGLDTGGMYFITDNPEKNGNYAIKSIELLATLHGILRFDMKKTQGPEDRPVEQEHLPAVAEDLRIEAARRLV